MGFAGDIVSRDLQSSRDRRSSSTEVRARLHRIHSVRHGLNLHMCELYLTWDGKALEIVSLGELAPNSLTRNFSGSVGHLCALVLPVK